MLRLFAESFTCTSHAHCATCRDPGDPGERWRRSLARAFSLPGDDVNFACPFGVEWGMGWAAQVVPVSIPAPERTGGCCGG